MKRSITILTVLLAGIVLFGCAGKTGKADWESELISYFESKPVSLNLIGNRTLSECSTSVQVPWYKVDVDYARFFSRDFLKNIPVPSGTETAYVAYYGDVGYKYTWMEEGKAVTRTKALLFDYYYDDYIVGPGPGKEELPVWYYEDRGENNLMSFRDSSEDEHGPYYVICLDHQPPERSGWSPFNDPPMDPESKLTWVKRGKPVCNMEPELEHIVAIIEINLTFDFSTWPLKSPIPLTRENLLILRNEAAGYSSPFELDFGLLKKDADSFEYLTQEGPLPAKPEVIQKLLYAFNTYPWEEIEQLPEFEQCCTSRLFITYVDEQGMVKEATIQLDDGRWNLKLPGNRYYSTWIPDLFYDAGDEITDEIPVMIYNKAIKHNSYDDEAYFNRAEFYAKKNENELAIQDYSKAIEINPANVEALNNRGEIYSATGETDKACSDWKRACELGDQEGCNYYNAEPGFFDSCKLSLKSGVKTE